MDVDDVHLVALLQCRTMARRLRRRLRSSARAFSATRWVSLNARSLARSCPLIRLMLRRAGCRFLSGAVIRHCGEEPGAVSTPKLRQHDLDSISTPVVFVFCLSVCLQSRLADDVLQLWPTVQQHFEASLKKASGAAAEPTFYIGVLCWLSVALTPSLFCSVLIQFIVVVWCCSAQSALW